MGAHAKEISDELAQLAETVSAFNFARNSFANLIWQGMAKELSGSPAQNMTRRAQGSQSVEGEDGGQSIARSPEIGSRLGRVLQFAEYCAATFEAVDESEIVGSQARAQTLWIGLGPSGQRDLAKHLSRLRCDGFIDEVGEFLAIHQARLIQRRELETLESGEAEPVDDPELLSLALEEIGLHADDLAIVGKVSIEQIERVSNTARGLGLEPQNLALLVKSHPNIFNADEPELRKSIVAFMDLITRTEKSGLRVELFSSVDELTGVLMS